ncbi:coniferyl aldehyde dehydrogenase [Oceanicoccus sagamiensis]|uniref:Aldehyde dehydrogenase n=1 Tax=Oceanicoccus sagamiensis TaxID=716816 RepID=A0A1X9N4L0_9GAMM|nr:coniferyl aldehyde dehydrogenase [Oceanicoccus sagamiensis]ARN73078.1 coniferyl aldehyde dehydrogenase [Oceanicoccus sagamiensis]
MNNNETIAANTSDLDTLFKNQRAAQLKDPYPSLALRRDRISRLIDMLVCHEKPLVEAVNTDFENRSALMTRAYDIMPTLENLKHVHKHIKRWMKPDKRNSRFPLGLLGAKSKVEYMPLGIVGNISPWNFPVQLALSPMADIFGAGNRIMLKPSELSPHTSEVMAQIIAGSFDETELGVVLGGPEVAAEFSSLHFDHLLFTGSTNIARRVAQSTAHNLVPMTLELGGKNPVVISSTADIKLAAEKVMWAKTLNGGQICLCPDTVFIPENLLESFVAECQASVKKMYADIAQTEEYTHIITQRHADRLTEMVAEAKGDGARVIPLFDEARGDKASRGRRVLPSLIVNADANSRVMQEEVFGALLPIMTYSNLQEVVDYINERPRPLALYYFGRSDQEIATLTYQTVSGGMVVNDMFAHILQSDLPFGGVGDSGMGAYHGFDGFKNFSHAKAIYHQSRLDPLKLLRPPYGKLIEKVVSSQIKR